MICLDNDVLRKFATSDPDQKVVRYLGRHRTEHWAVPSIVLFEYLQIYASHSRIRKERRTLEQHIDSVVAVDGDVAAQAANLKARLATAGVSLDLADLLVAACAREGGATLATANKHDFDKSPIHQLLNVDIVETV